MQKARIMPCQRCSRRQVNVPATVSGTRRERVFSSVAMHGRVVATLGARNVSAIPGDVESRVL